MSTPTIKYRAACDHCSATKIKCTQERPQCARCRTLGRDCHYSRSLRAGKPPRSSQVLNRKISNTPVLPRRATVLEPPHPASNGPLSHGFPTQPSSYPVMSPSISPDPTWTAVTHSSYPTPPAVAIYTGAEASPFYSELQTPDHSSATTPMDPEWFFDFNNAALPPTANSSSDSPTAASRINSREPTQQPSPISEGHRPSCTPQVAPAHILLPQQLQHQQHHHQHHHHDLSSGTRGVGQLHPNNNINNNTPLSLFTTTNSSISTSEGNSSTSSGSENHPCLRIATETLNGLYELPSILHVDRETRQFSLDQVLSSTTRAVQICHDLMTCPCVKDFSLVLAVAMIASKVLSWCQIVAFVRDGGSSTSSSSISSPVEGGGGGGGGGGGEGGGGGVEGFPSSSSPSSPVTMMMKDLVVDGQLALGDYKLDDRMGWVLKNHIVLGQLQRLSEIVHRYDVQFCGGEGMLGGQQQQKMMGEGGAGGGAGGLEVYASMSVMLRSRLQCTIQEVEGRLRASASAS